MELAVDVPAGWSALVHPRRDGLMVRAESRPAPGSAARLERLVEATSAEVETLVEQETGPTLSYGYMTFANATKEQREAAEREAKARAEAAKVRAREFAGILRTGEPGPLAAALRFALLKGQDPEVFADGWADGHGVGFAAAAAMEAAMLEPGRLALAESLWWRWENRKVWRRVRELMASASEEEYRDAVARIAAIRERNEISRIVAAYLAPTEAAWVAEAMGVPTGNAGLRLLKWCSVGSAGSVIPETHGQFDEETLANLLDGLGERVVDIFQDLPGLLRYSAERRLGALALLARIRTDAAFALLLKCLNEPIALPYLQEAAAARPVESAALCASLPQARPLLRGLLMSHPETRTPELLRAARLEPLVPEAATALLPAVLTDPSWGSGGAGTRGRRAADASGAGGASGAGEVGGHGLGRSPARLPKYGAWLRPAELPQIRLRADRSVAVPRAAHEHVVMCFALSRPGAVHPGVRQVREACEPRSLAEFAWAVFEMWRLAGMPAADGFALRALGWVGDDETVRRLTPIIRAWPGRNGHRRAAVGLDVLAEIGGEIALTHLHGIAQRLKYKGLKKRAGEKVAEVAAGLGLSGEQLEDRVVPAFGLSADGTRTIDYGGRAFTVGFDEQLLPFVINAKGKVRRSLPQPTGADDPDLVADARAWFSGLRRELKPVSAAQISRLERAMITQRSWSGTEFRTHLVEHPLLTHLVRRLLWTATGVRPGAPTAFRLAEDLTFTDVAGHELELPDTAVVRLAHPVLVEEREAWAELFDARGIVQPFAQLGRTVGRFSEAELKASALSRFVGTTVPAGRLMALRHRGWETPEQYATRPLPGGTALRVRLSPGLQTWHFHAADPQSLAEITLTGGVFGDLDPVTASELLADLEFLARPT